jgi:4-hydroxy-3-methylbut-2-enyl diphosphate reductase
VEELTVIEEDVEFLLPKELVQIESSKKPAASIAG